MVKEHRKQTERKMKNEKKVFRGHGIDKGTG